MSTKHRARTLGSKAISWAVMGAMFASGTWGSTLRADRRDGDNGGFNRGGRDGDNRDNGGRGGRDFPRPQPLPNYDQYDVESYEALLRKAGEDLKQAQAYQQSTADDARDANADLATVQKTVNALVDKQNQDESDIKRLQGSLQSARDAIQKADQDISKTQGEINQLKPAADAEQSRLSQLQSQSAQAEQKAQAAQATAAANSQSASAARAGANAKGKVFTDLSTERNAQLAVANNQKARAAQLAVQVQKLRELVNNGNALVQAQQAEVAKKTQELEADKAKEDAAKKAFEDAKKDLDGVTPRDPRFAELRKKLDQAKDDHEKAKRETDKDEREKNQAERQLAQLQNQAQGAQRQLPEAEQNLTQAQNAAAAAQQKADGLEGAVNSAARDYNAADAEAKALEAQAAPFQAAARQARTEADSVAASVKASDSKLRDLKSRIESANSTISSLQASKQTNARAMDQATAGINAERGEIDNLKRQIDAQQPNLKRAGDNARQANQRWQDAAGIVQSHQANVDQVSRRLEEVRRFRAAAVAQAQLDGQQDGQQDGATEGDRAARERGAIEGGEAGARTGRDDGTRDGINAARSAGAQQGTTQAQADGDAQGAQQGYNVAKLDGTNKGRTDGLAEGYKIGYQQGWSDGKSAGDTAGKNMGGYEKGQTDGYAEGKARAQSDGTAQGSAEGTDRADREAHAVELNNVTLPNRDLNAASSTMRQWDWHHNPGYHPHRNYPHPVINAAYLDAYERTFYAAAGRQFDAVYPAIYEGARAQAYQATYNAAFQADYSADREAARVTAYNSSFEPARQAAYNREYNNAYNGFYEDARQAALPVRQEEGKATGQKEGFEYQKNATFAAEIDRGKQEARPRGYNDNIAGFTDDARAKAYEAQKKFYAENASLELEGIVIRDANEDDVFAPGEKATLTVTLKNWGKVATSKPVVVDLSSSSKSIKIEIPSDQLVALPAQSRAQVTFVAPLTILGTAKDGDSVALKARVSHDGKVVGQNDLSFKIAYPYSVTDVALAANVATGAPVKGTLTIHNRSTKASAQALTVKLESTDGLSQILTPELAPGVIASNADAKSEFSFSVDSSNAFKELAFRASVFEGDKLVGIRVFGTASGKKWAYDSASDGLIVVTSRSAGSLSTASIKLLEERFDIWDEQIDGDLTTEVALKYLGKGLVIPQADGSIEQGTATAVEAFLKKGGDVLSGGDVNGSSPVSKVLARAAGSLTRSTFDGLSVYEANFFKAKATPAQVVFAAAQASQLEPAELAQAIHGFKLVTESITEKATEFLKAAQADTALPKAKRAADAIFREITKELADDDALKGKVFQEKPSTTRLASLVSFIAARTGNDRKTLQSLLPEIKKAIDAGPGMSRRMAARKILKPIDR